MGRVWSEGEKQGQACRRCSAVRPAANHLGGQMQPSSPHRKQRRRGPSADRSPTKHMLPACMPAFARQHGCCRTSAAAAPHHAARPSAAASCAAALASPPMRAFNALPRRAPAPGAFSLSPRAPMFDLRASASESKMILTSCSLRDAANEIGSCGVERMRRRHQHEVLSVAIACASRLANCSPALHHNKAA